MTKFNLPKLFPTVAKSKFVVILKPNYGSTNISG